MKVLPGIRDAEADDHLVEEARLRQLESLAPEIISDEEDQLVFARAEFRPLQHGTVAAPVLVCRRGLQQLRLGSASVQFDAYPAAGFPRATSKTWVVILPMLSLPSKDLVPDARALRGRPALTMLIDLWRP